MALGLKAAGSTAVARQRFDCMVQRTLYLGVELLVLQLFSCNPFGCSHQGGLFFQVAGIPLPLLSAGGTSVLCSLLAIGILQNVQLYRRHY